MCVDPARKVCVSPCRASPLRHSGAFLLPCPILQLGNGGSLRHRWSCNLLCFHSTPCDVPPVAFSQDGQVVEFQGAILQDARAGQEGFSTLLKARSRTARLLSF